MDELGVETIVGLNVVSNIDDCNDLSKSLITYICFKKTKTYHDKLCLGEHLKQSILISLYQLMESIQKKVDIHTKIQIPRQFVWPA